MADKLMKDEVDYADTKTSKLEVALKLTTFSFISITAAWIGADAYGILYNNSAALDIGSQIFPFLTANAGALIGFIMGDKNKN